MSSSPLTSQAIKKILLRALAEAIVTVSQVASTSTLQEQSISINCGAIGKAADACADCVASLDNSETGLCRVSPMTGASLWPPTACPPDESCSAWQQTQRQNCVNSQCGGLCTCLIADTDLSQTVTVNIVDLQYNAVTEAGLLKHTLTSLQFQLQAQAAKLFSSLTRQKALNTALKALYSRLLGPEGIRNNITTNIRTRQAVRLKGVGVIKNANLTMTISVSMKEISKNVAQGASQEKFNQVIAELVNMQQEISGAQSDGYKATMRKEIAIAASLYVVAFISILTVVITTIRLE